MKNPTESKKKQVSLWQRISLAGKKVLKNPLYVIATLYYLALFVMIILGARFLSKAIQKDLARVKHDPQSSSKDGHSLADQDQRPHLLCDERADCEVLSRPAEGKCQGMNEEGKLDALMEKYHHTTLHLTPEAEYCLSQKATRKDGSRQFAEYVTNERCASHCASSGKTWNKLGTIEPYESCRVRFFLTKDGSVTTEANNRIDIDNKSNGTPIIDDSTSDGLSHSGHTH